MRILSALIALALLLPAQVPAAGPELFKPKAKPLPLVQNGGGATLSEFYLTRGDGRTDWFVTVTNNTGSNMALNVYEIPATQSGNSGTPSPAGSFSIPNDIRPGRTANFQKQFTPITGLTRVTIEVVDTRNDRVIGSGTFSAATINPANTTAPASTAAASAAAATAASATKPSAVDDTLLDVNIAEGRDAKVTLTMTNRGKTSINLARYDVNLQGHVWLRGVETEQVAFTETLKPGASATRTVTPPKLRMCSNFTQYAATAEDKGTNLAFEGRLDTPPVRAKLGELSLQVNYNDKTFGFSGGVGEWVIIRMKVTNTSEGFIHGASAIGTLIIDGGKMPYPFEVPVGLDLGPGQSKLVDLSLNVCYLNEFNTGVYVDIRDMWDKTPKFAAVAVHLGNPYECGLSMPLSKTIRMEWKL